MKLHHLILLATLGLLTACSKDVTYTVNRGVLDQKIEVTGELVSADTINLKPPVIRRVWQYQIKMLVAEGAQVAKGQVVAQLDTSELVQRLSVKSARLETTIQDIKTSTLRNAQKLQDLKLSLAEAEMNQKKAQLKVDISDATVSEIDKKKYVIEATIANDKVALVQQQIKLEINGAKQRQKMLVGDKQKFTSEVAALKKGIQSLTLIAPRSGMVVYGIDAMGNKVAEGQSIYVGDAILSMPELDNMQVNMTIPEVEAGRVKVGQTLKVRLDANPDRIFNGKIKQLGAVFRVKNQDVPLTIFDAVATVTKPDSSLMRPGMTAKVAIDVTSNKPQLLLPLDAIEYKNGQAFVQIEGFFQNRLKSITLGKMGTHQVEVLTGLQAGDEVVLP
ncbi:efflux RND transporter periplasmic adaptor subunit [Shewanella intestini]|uniref:HlyD family efflux transporter periplasmic adaptor subunit n=1 Tax=Shewanella intestini TaxID=2017544 RepID=A0ABS5I1F3_9GAMM|nr:MULTISPECIES: efflux RND transporter periplasmic adaptor subunit [Shewanella]MBR9727160.1 HlyD family efflux transporter periplasmic adaptor subunit [Shewanella intestini]MRG35962.1 HlyD family efflux transporter periplasmic adaptor subunit [Shewanella sp. XMDDZSB0408]